MENKTKKTKVDYAAIIREYEMYGRGLSLKQFCDDSDVVGDAILLPSRIKIDHPTIVPLSQTVKFWQKWNEKDLHQDLNMAVTNMIKQSKN